jgi:hypothetical protein
MCIPLFDLKCKKTLRIFLACGFVTMGRIVFFFYYWWVEPDETLMGNVISHCRHLVNFRFKPNDLLYLANVLNGFMNHEPVKISVYAIDVLFKSFKLRSRHHTLALTIQVDDHLN